MEQQYQQWLMALSAPIVALNIGATFDSPQFFPYDNTFDLTEGWGISSRAELIDMVTAMTDNGHAGRLAHYYYLWHRFSHTQWVEYVEHGTDEDQVLLKIVAQTAAICGDGGIRSWDLGRMGFLCRIGQLHGWFSAEENLWFHSRLAVRARHYYDNWESYYAAYLVGRVYWQSLDKETPEQQQYAFSQQSGTQSNVQIIRELSHRADSPVKHLVWHIDYSEMEKPASLAEVDWS